MKPFASSAVYVLSAATILAILGTLWVACMLDEADENDLDDFLHATASANKPIAVVYAYPTYHEEINVVMACSLRTLGYAVVMYVQSGNYVAGAKVPFSGRRKRRSVAFYGHCVDQWVTIQPDMPLIPHPALVVFDTYPMTRRNLFSGASENDPQAIRILEGLRAEAHTSHIGSDKASVRMKDQGTREGVDTVEGSKTNGIGSSKMGKADYGKVADLRNSSESVRMSIDSGTKVITKVIFVVHKSHLILSMASLVERYVARAQCTYMFLSEHTRREGKRVLTKSMSMSMRAAMTGRLRRIDASMW